MSEQDQYQMAQKRARELAAFYRHVVSYAVGLIFLAILNVITSPGDWWVQWAALGWGFFVLKHAWKTFGANALFDKNWEERKTAELMGEKSKRKNAEDYFEESPAE